MLPFRSSAALALSAMLVAASGAARADDAAEVKQLLRTGQTTEASAKLDQFLAAKPKDPQLRFLKGVLLTESGQTAEAIDIFVALTVDYPELAEPYNNLAVIYAGQGRYDKARVALEAAIRGNPNYATAYENLGDVYARLAAQAYARGQQLDPGNAELAPKLARLQTLFTLKPVAAQAAASAASAAAAKNPS
ncbi:MAG TPA: tetratricopeptide repeat protein [Burkholderiaceae bacterium]|nr:tetratricopeptide repeat protein [Burkholderiaceae bacterium]